MVSSITFFMIFAVFDPWLFANKLQFLSFILIKGGPFSYSYQLCYL